MKKLADDLKSVNKEINALSKKLEQLSKKADKLLKAVAGKKVKTKAVPKKKTVKKKANVAKAAAVKKTVKKKAKKPAASDTPTSKVLTLMKRYKKGVAIAKLKQGSGLSDKQISNILHRASKEGKIKRVARGVYQLA